MGRGKLTPGDRPFRRSQPLPIGAVLPPDTRVLAAVSGGFDSVLMATLLAEQLGAARLAIAHVHHGLRGAEADADEALVRRLAERHGVACLVARLEWPPGANPDEATLRSARLGRLRALAAEANAGAIAYGHTRDDLAETFLMNALRGAGPDGLAAMVPVRRDADGLLHWRPLLLRWRAELRALPQAAGLAWREDASNRHVRFLRNRVRREALPWLARFHNGAAAGFANAALACGMERPAARAAAEAALARASVGGHRGAALLVDLNELRRDPPETIVAAIRAGWESVAPSRTAPGRHLAPDRAEHGIVARLLAPGEPALHREDGVVLWANSRWAVLAAAEHLAAALDAVRTRWPFVVLADGEAHPLPERGGVVAGTFGELEVHAAGEGAAPLLARLRGELPHRVLALPRASLAGCVLRPAREGERLGAKRIDALLAEARVPAPLRANVGVVALGEAVLAIPGVR
jgi:tRNA(Ile)-lysidine synthase